MTFFHNCISISHYRMFLLTFALSLTFTHSLIINNDTIYYVNNKNRFQQQPISSNTLSAVDLSWDFTHGLEGWAQATYDEMRADIYSSVSSGEIHITNIKEGQKIQEQQGNHINGDDDEILHDHDHHVVHLDSPPMKIPLHEKQVFSLRYRYAGRSKYGKIRLRISTDTPKVIDHGLSAWSSNQNMESAEGSENDNKSTMDQKEDLFIDVHFKIKGDWLWHVAYASMSWDEIPEIHRKELAITQIRLWPGCYYEMPKNIATTNKQGFDESLVLSEAPQSGNVFYIDWIRLVRSPIIHRVTGCHGEKYFANSFEEYVNNDDQTTNVDSSPVHDVVRKASTINGILKHYRTFWKRRENNLPFSLTYNCVREGGERITIEGLNFGAGGVNGSGAPAHVFIDNHPCKYVVHDEYYPQSKLSCITPKFSLNEYGDQIQYSTIEIRNGKLPGLVGRVNGLKYAIKQPSPVNITLSNFAARSVDLSWIPGGSIWDQMTCTGFVIRWREVISKSWRNEMVIGNITTTSIRGLAPDTEYLFGISALNENQNISSWFDTLDLYGRRKKIDGGLEGKMSTTIGRTLVSDVSFDRFNANLTQNHGPLDSRISIGPTGIKSGEGHYGLIVVGDANIENCNSTSFCCDSYNETSGHCDDEWSYTCTFSDYQSSSHNSQTASLPGLGRVVKPLSESEFKYDFDSKCGPVLRLTPSERRQTGAMWYPRQLEVGEGFDTQFTFRLSNPSFRCNNMNDIHTRCRSRGGDGLAFVFQADNQNVLGRNGSSLGYDGIQNGIAVEFDTYYNYEEIDPYENHVSVHTRGWRHPLSSNHTFSLGSSNAIPDLTDGPIHIRIIYEPVFDESQLSKPNFVLSPYLSYFFQNGDFGKGGNADWSQNGLGILKVYCQNIRDGDEPVLIIPLNVDATIKLNRGRAWVGFTAATGDDTWQAHDILNWSFTSLRMDKYYEPAIAKYKVGMEEVTIQDVGPIIDIDNIRVKHYSDK